MLVFTRNTSANALHVSAVADCIILGLHYSRVRIDMFRMRVGKREFRTSNDRKCMFEYTGFEVETEHTHVMHVVNYRERRIHSFNQSKYTVRRSMPICNIEFLTATSSSTVQRSYVTSRIILNFAKCNVRKRQRNCFATQLELRHGRSRKSRVAKLCKTREKPTRHSSGKQDDEVVSSLAANRTRKLRRH